MHSHTNHSIDGKASPDEMVARAHELGIGIYDISDHCDVNRDAELHCYERSLASITDALRLKAEYSGRMKVLAGIEVGNPHWDPVLAERCIAIPGIDCVIGSVHRIKHDGEVLVTSTADFASMSPELLRDLNIKYFEDILLMLDTLHPDILAHPTYMFRYMVNHCHVDASVADYKPYVDAFLHRMIADGTALELNTSIVADHIEPYDVFVLERYFELGGRLITLGSDAHRPDRIANGFDLALRELLRVGFTHICSVEERQFVSHRIN